MVGNKFFLVRVYSETQPFLGKVVGTHTQDTYFVLPTAQPCRDSDAEIAVGDLRRDKTKWGKAIIAAWAAGPLALDLE
jgi:hypothetical protein